MCKLNKKIKISLTLVAIFGLALYFGFSQAETTQAGSTTVTGRVVKPNGTAAGVGYQVCLNADFACEENCGNCTDTQNDGTFSTSVGQAGMYRVEIQVSPESPYTSNAPLKVNLSGTSVNVGDIKLTNPSLQGYTTNPTGATIIGDCNITLRTEDWTQQWNTRSDADDGSFRLGGIAAGDYKLEVWPPEDSEYTRVEYDVTITDPSTVKNLGAVKLGTVNIIGRIVDPDGNTMTFGENCWGDVDIYSNDHSYQQHTNADQDGYFRFGTVPTNTYTLEVRASAGCGFSNATPKSISVTSGTLLNVGKVKLSTPLVKGTVYDTDGSTPLRDVWVQVHNEDWSQQQGSNSGEDGKYQIGGLDLSKGPFFIRAERPWNRSDLISSDDEAINLVAGTTITKNITMSAATKFLTGYVKKSDGSAVTNGEVNANKMGGGSHANAQTGPDGSYSLALSGGTWEVHLHSRWDPDNPADWIYNQPPTTVEFANNTTTETKTQNFTVQIANAVVRGKVVKPDGSPLTEGHVDVRNEEGQGNGQPINHDGTFQISVAAGSYKVEVWSPDNALTFPSKKVTVAENETVDVGTITAREKKARIMGTVTKKDGTALPDIRVNAWKHMEHGWAQATSESDGTFVLAVDQGRWGVGIDQGASTRYVYDGEPIDVDIPEENTIVTDITLKLTYADAAITGHVIDTNGDTVLGFCSWAYARPVTTTTAFGPGPEYGSNVNCQTGEFTIYVPSSVASIYTLGLHMPPNSDWLPLGEQNVAVLADSTSTKDIIVQAPDAEIVGQLYDQNGTALTSCINPVGHWFGDVNLEKEGMWRHAEIKSDCTYRVSLLSGMDYRMHYWINENVPGFMQSHPDPTPFDVPKGTTVKNITVKKTDATLSGYVLDPDGNPADAGVWCGNWVEFDEKDEGPTEEDMKNELHSWAKTDPKDGSYTVYLLSGHRYMCGTGLPPESDLLPGEEKEINLMTAKSATYNFALKKALGKMTGTVRIGGGAGIPVNHGFCWGWNEKGGHTGGEVRYGGSYSLNYSEGTWHFGCDSFDGRKFYRSPETTIVITNQTSLSQDFNLDESLFSMPPAVSQTFDAGNPQVITLENGTSVNIPAGALGESGTNVTVTATPVVDMYKSKTDQVFGCGYKLEATDADNNEITTFNSNVTITFTYSEEVLAEYGLSENALGGKYLDETTTTYKDISGGCTINKNADEITCKTNHFTKFAVTGAGGAAFGGGALGPADIMATPASQGGPQIILADENGNIVANFFAYSSDLRIGIEAVTADVNGDGANEIIVAPGAGAGSQVRVFDKSGNLLTQFFAYDESMRTGIHVTAADVTGDGVADIITSPMAGAGPQVKVFDSVGSVLAQDFVYAETYRGGLDVVTGDVKGDGVDDIVAVPDSEAGPQIKIWDVVNSTKSDFFAYDTGVRGGFNVALGDIDGDGTSDIVVTPKAGLGPQVAVFKSDGTLISRFFAYASTFRGGINASVGDTDGDGSNDIIACPESEAGPQMRVFDGLGNAKSQFFAYASTLRGKFTSFVADLNGDGTNEIVTAPGEGMGPQVRSFDKDGNALSQFFTHHTGFRGGLNMFPAY